MKKIKDTILGDKAANPNFPLQELINYLEGLENEIEKLDDNLNRLRDWIDQLDSE